MNGEKYIILTNQKKARIAILISDKVDFKVRKIIRDKGHYIVRKGSCYLKRHKNLNMYNSRASNHVIHKLIEMWGEINDSIVRFGNSTPLSEMDRSSG